jgi:hypothetical protein
MRSDELLDKIYEVLGEDEQTKTDLINHMRVWMSEDEAKQCLADFCADYDIIIK